MPYRTLAEQAPEIAMWMRAVSIAALRMADALRLRSDAGHD